MTLIEVLAAIGIMSIGLLAMAALLPVGQYTISKADQGRHLRQHGPRRLHDMLTRGMLTSANLGTAAFVNDPVGAAAGAKFGGGRGAEQLAGHGSTPTDDLVVPLPGPPGVRRPPPAASPMTAPTRRS